MKLLFDQNLSPRLPQLLADLFPDSAHVRAFGMSQAADPVVWAYARANAFAVVTKDDDYQRWASQLGQTPKVIWVRLGNCPTKRIADLLRDRFAGIVAFENDPNASVLELP